MVRTATFHALRVATTLCVVLLLLACRVAVAGAAPAAHRAVLLESERNAHPPLRALLDATRGPLAELGVELVVALRPGTSGLAATTQAAQQLAVSTQAVAVVWLDTERRGASTRSVLYFFDPLRSRLLTRQVDVSASEAAAAEEVAVVLRSAISALLEGEEVAMTEVAVPQPKPVSPPAPPAARLEQPKSEALGLGLGLGYVGSIFTDELTWQSGGRLSLALSPPASRWRVSVAYEFLMPLRSSSAEVTTRVLRHPGELALGHELLSGAFGLAPEFGLIGDAVTRETERAEAPLVATEPSTRWLWAISMRLRALRTLGPQVSLLGVIGADFVLNPFDQVTADRDARASVSSLLAVRPRLEAGLLVRLW